MNILKQLKRWRRRKKITLTDLTPLPLHFTIASHVEEFRIARYGGERETLLYFLSQLKPEDVLYDIGASLGLYTVSAASVLKEGQVIAFEPDPETRISLESNLQRNHLTNVRLIRWAVSNTPGLVTLYTNGIEGRAPSLARRDSQPKPARSIKIKADTLDAAVARDEFPPPDVIKIDIEGAEGLCLRGGSGILSGKFGKRPRAILIEFHPQLLPGFNTSPQEVKGLLEDAGYLPTWSQPRENQEHVLYRLNSEA
jgi:FkbM family methyltransferase